MNARDLFVMDPDLIDHRLDLGRPELRPIRDRYAPQRALIVKGQDGASRVEDALISEGWQVANCEGPGRTRCPLLEGKPCYLRKSADVAVVYVDAKKTRPGSGVLPRLRCAVDAASPAVVVLEGRVDPPRVTERCVVVSALRGPREIVNAVGDAPGRWSPPAP